MNSRRLFWRWPHFRSLPLPDRAPPGQGKVVVWMFNQAVKDRLAGRLCQGLPGL